MDKKVIIFGAILVFAIIGFAYSLQSNFDGGCSKDFPYKTICGEGTEHQEECCCNSKERWYSYNNLFDVGEKLRDVGGVCVPSGVQGR